MSTAHVSDRPLNLENIPGKLVIYRRFLKKILRKSKITKGRLDMYQVYLRRINSFIQLSVIYIAAASTFIQALTSKSYDVIFESSTDNLLNDTIDTTDTTTTSNIIDQNTLTQLVPIITLSTTTYASIIIAGARHMKIEEREGNVLNLVGRFAELINRIKYHIDVLEPWQTEEYYTNDNSGSKVHEWVSLMTKVEKEYTHIVDVKRELYTTYDKLIDSSLYRSYKKKFNTMRNDPDAESDSDDEIFLKKATEKGDSMDKCVGNDSDTDSDDTIASAAASTEPEPEPESEPRP